VLDQVTELEVALQDRMVDVLGDVTLRLVANSTRGIRRKLTRLQFGLVNPRAQCASQRTMFHGAHHHASSPRAADTRRTPPT
jgi:hypothetical protein